MEKDPVPEEHASDEAGTGGADSPEEPISTDEDVSSEKDVDEVTPSDSDDSD